jgi:hypothetical protein
MSHFDGVLCQLEPGGTGIQTILEWLKPKITHEGEHAGIQEYSGRKRRW